MLKYKNYVSTLNLVICIIILSNNSLYPEQIFWPYGSHQPILRIVVLNTSGPILELGAGDFSTQLLHDICKDNKRFILSAESDEEWLNKFKDLETSWHKFIYASSWRAWDEVGSDIHWNVVLVDHVPANRRVIDIKRLRSHTDIFVVHDTNHSGYGYEPLLSTFKYKYVYKKYDPETTVISDTIDITKFFDEE